MEASSSSKVTVEYHDPSGVFPLISRDLHSRLPLRNLNWQSHARPLRQIKYLHVDFVPSSETQLAQRLPSTQKDARLPNSIDILRSGFEPPRTATKERRHQIPGLKTTPYLKIYVLRCDDKDWYKQEEKRKLQEWVKDNKAEETRSEHHDASEWLILHVVIPDTVAASEPRWRESTRDPDELKERSKGKKTVLDRLRADFNDGKSGRDHTAQIRLSKNQIAVDLLPVPALARTIEETADEREKSWSDFISKIRTTILSSFDARVRQYEDDIAEQEGRRSLPGWNFCTFFIHKEGLAKALESVGLVEDALAIYDELSLGLETVLGDIASGEAARTATSFPPTGQGIVDRIVGDSASGNDKPGLHRLFNKDYREEIVRSAISVFDFFCYLFERQISLLLRLAGRSGGIAVSGIKEGGDDLVMLAEVCWRGLSFIHNAARTLRQDLLATLSPTETQDLTQSWIFAAADLVLSFTLSSHLDLTDAGLKTQGRLANGHVSNGSRSEFGFSMGADPYPQRNSSLPSKKSSTAPELKSVTSASSAGKRSEDGFFSPPSSSGNDAAKPGEVPGLAELAAYRAELTVLKRKSLDLLAASEGWYLGWTALRRTADLAKVHNLGTDQNGANAKRRFGKEIARCLRDRHTYEASFELLTETTARHYYLATHLKSAENFMGDLAVLKYSQDDLIAAVTYFEHALPMFEVEGWHDLQMQAQALYVEGLCQLERYVDAAKQLLNMLAKVTRRRSTGSEGEIGSSILKTASLERLLAIAELLEDPLIADFADFFDDLHFDQEVVHSKDLDGFRHRLRFNPIMEQVDIDAITATLTHVEHTKFELRSSSQGKLHVTQGSVDVELVSSSMAFGMFAIDCLDIRIGNVVFRHNLRPQDSTEALSLIDKPEETTERFQKRPLLLLYSSVNAFDAHIAHSTATAVHKARYVTVQIDTGHNEISVLKICLKPASAGLRIHTDDIRLHGIQKSSGSAQHGIISTQGIAAGSKASIDVRYSLETMISELDIRAEIEYKTSYGVFTFLQEVRLHTQLPLDIEVKDSFHLNSLFSTFTARTTDGRPVMLNNLALLRSAAYAVTSPDLEMQPVAVLADQPAEYLYKINRDTSMSKKTSKADSALEIAVDCMPIVELITQIVTDVLDAAISSSAFKALRRLLIPTAKLRCLSTYTEADLELAALLGSTKVPSFADLGWVEVVDTLPHDMQKPLSDWLMKWHIDNQRIELNSTGSLVQQRRITIAVEVPTLDHVFLSNLKMSNSPDGILVAGQLYAVQMRIQYTSGWSSHAGQGPTKSSKRPDFVYELLADPEVWLLDGSTRSSFTPLETEGEITAELLIIALKTGTWALPSIVVRPALVEAPDVAENASVSYEASCTSAGQTVQVIDGRRRTRTVVVDQKDEHAVEAI